MAAPKKASFSESSVLSEVRSLTDDYFLNPCLLHEGFESESDNLNLSPNLFRFRLLFAL